MLGNGPHSSKLAGAAATTLAVIALGAYGMSLRVRSAPSKRRRQRNRQLRRLTSRARTRSNSSENGMAIGSGTDEEEVAEDMGHGLEEEHEVQSGAALVNDLVARQWLYVSEWFGNTVRHEIGPRLRGMARITECHLGTKPAVFHALLGTATYLQEWPCDDWDRRNVRVEGELDYSGDGKICVEVPSVGAHVEMTLVVRGTVVIELVKVTDKPPFCGGFRVYFPDKPEVFFRGFERPAWLDAAAHFLTGKSLDRFILDEIKKGITKHAVLPRRFANGLSWNIDPVFLRYPRPQGVLRISAELHTTQAATAGHGQGWLGKVFHRHRLPKAAEESPRNELVELTLGADTKHQDRWDEGKPHDFLVTEWGRQSLRVAVRQDQASSAAELHAEALLADIIHCQGRNVHGVFGPAVYWLPLYRTDEEDVQLNGIQAGMMQLKAEWRPFAEGAANSREMLAGKQCPTWHLGMPREAAWGLVVDLYHATGLPAAEEGTKHWAKISVYMEDGEACPASVSSHAPARTPRDHALAALKQKFGGEAVDNFAGQCQSIAPDAWRSLLGRGGPNITSSHAVDVVWQDSFCHLLDSRRTLVDSIAAAKVVVTVCRGETRGRSREREVGSAYIPLSQMLKKSYPGTVACIPLHGLLPGLDGAARRAVVGHLQLGLQVRPLKGAPDMRGVRSIRLKRALQTWMTPLLRNWENSSVGPVKSPRQSPRQIEIGTASGSSISGSHSLEVPQAPGLTRMRSMPVTSWQAPEREMSIGMPSVASAAQQMMDSPRDRSAEGGGGRLESQKKWSRWLVTQTTPESAACNTAASDGTGSLSNGCSTPGWGRRWLPWVRSDSCDALCALDAEPKLDDVD